MEPEQTDLLHEIRSYIEQWFPDFCYRKPDDYFFAALYVEFRGLDLLEEIKNFHAWCLDKNDQQMNYRIALRRWLRKGVSFRETHPRP
jgi:hypothetical protein